MYNAHDALATHAAAQSSEVLVAIGDGVPDGVIVEVS